MFIDEEQWSRAYSAAVAQAEALYCAGKLELPSGKVNGSLRKIAIEIATAALRAAAQDDQGDITDGDIPGVQVQTLPLP